MSSNKGQGGGVDEHRVTIEEASDTGPKPNVQYQKYPAEKRRLIINICELVVFVLGVGCCVASFLVPALRDASFRGLLLWQYCLLASALLCGHLLSVGIQQFLLLFIDNRFSARENALYYVAGLVENASAVLWFGTILVAWNWVVKQPSYLGFPPHERREIAETFAKTYRTINMTLVTILVGSLLWLVKDILVMKWKSEFHIRRFFGRVVETLKHQLVVETLSPLGQRAPSAANDEDEKTEVVGRGKVAGGDEFRTRREGCCKKRREVNLSCLRDVSQQNVSCYAMKILIEEIRKRTPELSYTDSCGEVKIRTVGEALDAADTLFSALGQKKEELNQFITDKEASDIAHFRKWMVKAFNTRALLLRALEDNKKLFQTFNRFVNVLLLFLIFILWLVILKVEFRRVIVVLGSALAASAVFVGDFTKKLIDNFSFVFLMHPFDVGDYCLIDNTLVKIDDVRLFTTLAEASIKETRLYPNSYLVGLPITNYTRSQHVSDMVEFYLKASSCPVDGIESLEKKIKSYIGDIISHDDYEWEPTQDLTIEFDGMDKIKIALKFTHTIDYVEFEERSLRKTKLTLKLKDFFDNLQK